MTAKTRLVFEGENRTTRAFNAINTSLGRMKSRLTSVAFSAKGFVGILAGGAFARAGRNQIEFANNIQKVSLRLNASTEALSELAFAADRSNIPLSTLEKALQNIDRVTGDALRGLATAGDAFDELGIDARAFSQLRIEDKVEALAIAFKDLNNNSTRINLANTLFGGRGVSFLQLLEEGADGIRDLRQEARSLGLTISRDVANQAAQFEDELTNIGGSFRGLLIELGQSGALSALNTFIKTIGNLVRLLRGVELEGPKKAIQEPMQIIIDKGNDANKVVERLRTNLDGVFKPKVDRSEAFPEFPVPTVDEVREQFRQIEPAFSDAQFRIADVLTGAAEEGAQGMRNAFQRQLQQMFIDLASSAFLRLLKNVFGGGGGFLGALGGLFGGGRASGGPVTGGRTYLVGERGPELFTASSNGSIVPNHQLGGGMTINVDARGAGPGVGAEVRQAVAQAVALSNASINDKKNRGRF